MTPRVGLIEWVENTAVLKETIYGQMTEAEQANQYVCRCWIFFIIISCVHVECFGLTAAHLGSKCPLKQWL